MKWYKQMIDKNEECCTEGCCVEETKSEKEAQSKEECC